MKRNALQTLVFALSALASASVGQTAQADDALYPETPPADAAFVRSLAGAADPSETGGIPPSAIAAIAEGEARYAALSVAEFPALTAGSFSTLVAAPDGGLRLVPEPQRADRSKVHLILLNASGQDVRLAAPEHGVEVVSTTAPFSAKAQAVNPIEVVLAVEDTATGAPVETFDLRLRRGQNLTFFVGPDGARLVENAFGPVIRGD